MGLKRALRRKLDMKISKSDERIEKDPYLLLGYGLNSYFEIMISLMKMMIFVSIFAVALMSRFSQFSALSKQAGFQVYSVGNMGGAEAVCEVA